MLAFIHGISRRFHLLPKPPLRAPCYPKTDTEPSRQHTKNYPTRRRTKLAAHGSADPNEYRQDQRHQRVPTAND